MFVIVALPLLKDIPPDHKSFGLDKFCKFTAKEQHRICYVHPSIIAEVFPKGIEKLKPHSRKLELDALQAESSCPV